ncbi:MAG: hypothetical protein GYB31_07525 [Bacteroidetes bacterium]|nr:hypothetical protein [Bacteroidota bacterium]
MNTREIQSILQDLAGHLVLETQYDQEQFSRLNDSLKKTELTQPKSTIKGSNFSFERSDLFGENRIESTRIKQLNQLVSKKKEPTYRMYAREVPIREQLLQNSIPDWAAGAKVDHTIGPFVHKDGRQFWYDFYPIEKLIALYLQGDPNPVLLFNIRQFQFLEINLNLPPNFRMGKTYTLSAGSIWINSQKLTAGAPTGSYTGLKISGGKISLSKSPVDQLGKLTATPGTNISVSLKLDQPEASDVDAESTFGVDAREMNLNLPSVFSFQFSHTSQAINEVGDAAWNLFQQPADFSWNSDQSASYNPAIQRILIPFTPSQNDLEIGESLSAFNKLSGESEIQQAAWALPVASIDINQPVAAAGIGGLMVQTGSGIRSRWSGLEAGSIDLPAPVFMAHPGQVLVGDLAAQGPHANYKLDLWTDEINEFGTSAELAFPNQALFYFSSNANGNELILALANARFNVDRPVTVSGEPPEVQSLQSLLMLGISTSSRLIYLYDDNLIQDDFESSGGEDFELDSMALALSNALFKVTQANGCLLFGSLSADFKKVENGLLFLTFGLFSYMPTLPDPYAANLGAWRELQEPRKNYDNPYLNKLLSLYAWLVCRVKWEQPAEDDGMDEVEVSFHFAALSDQFAGVSLEEEEEPTDPVNPNPSVGTNLVNSPTAATFNLNFASTKVEPINMELKSASKEKEPLPDQEQVWDKYTHKYGKGVFSLLDVSTNADLFGISFDSSALSRYDNAGIRDTKSNVVPFVSNIQISGMDVISSGKHVRAFMVPQISWEPLINLTPPEAGQIGDPPFGPNYFPDDGGPTEIVNNGEDTVALAPLPLTAYLLDHFEQDTDGFKAYSLMTLPFGMRAVALLKNQYSLRDDPSVLRQGSRVSLNAQKFANDLSGGLQLKLEGGASSITSDSDMFKGNTMQINNVVNIFGQDTETSNLGRQVSLIFNGEFAEETEQDRGVPLERIDLSGYGATSFSNWLNPKAAFAETSQVKFDIVTGRTSHEIVQVKSVLYPWGIKVVRTITIFRVSSGYVYRFDSGWKAESEGEFDFRYWVNETSDITVGKESPFEIHPGLVKGLYNVTNIENASDVASLNIFMSADAEVNSSGLYEELDPPQNKEVILDPVYFDADVLFENVQSGFKKKVINGEEKKIVPSKKILGYVQIAPKGLPINKETLAALIAAQGGTIGGPVDCEVNLAKSGQMMRLTRFDVNNSVAADNSSPVFVVAGRGSVLLPRQGSWSLVKHERESGEVSPVPTNLSVPVIREGALVGSLPGSEEAEIPPLELNVPEGDVLLRIANPSEILRNPTEDTINYGFLQNTDTQKALFLTPAFEMGLQKLISKTPPLFVDAFRIVNTKSIFPNIGTADSDFGEAVSLIESVASSAFEPGDLSDLGAQTWELMDIHDTIDDVKEQGYKLLKGVADKFNLPPEFELINLGDGQFRIYIEYSQGGTDGKLDFDIDSLADNWKSKLENVGLVVDLGGIDRLLTIRGSWDSKNGSEASYPEPKLIFSDELQPVIDVLEILQKLQGEDYAGAVASGLKLAMSNKAASWEYKFEASKEIPVLRFPFPDALYNDPNAPFKIEAGLKLGAYFNGAVMLTTDLDELKPSAGAFLGFYGRLSVMCVSLSAVTVYAIGQANVDIAADTEIGPSLRMKFGFGAQIVIGLPVAGNVSVLYMVGVEMFIASGILEVSAFLLFEGHAEILGGIVSITIMIEAKGTVSKKTLGDGSRTDLACQVTFGLDISIFLVININFSTSWQEQRQIA